MNKQRCINLSEVEIKKAKMLLSIHLISNLTIVPLERILQNKTNRDKKMNRMLSKML